VKNLMRYAATLAYAFSAVALGATVGQDISKVNGSVRLEAGQLAGDVSTVNGSVTIERGATAEEVGTVNGSVRIQPEARVRTAETVNGAIVVGEGAEILEGISTVNGALTLGAGARVGGAVENVNGNLTLEGAQVGGRLETVNGDIHVGANSRVAGGIHVEENKSWFKRSGARNPRVTIEAGAVIEGPLHFEREVDLYTVPGATLPPIEGTAPRRYTLE
jgi:DUF4097 and DUF4098 domain-containing protein YvlB